MLKYSVADDVAHGCSDGTSWYIQPDIPTEPYPIEPETATEASFEVPAVPEVIT